MNDISKIVFAKEQFGDDLWEAVAKQLELLMKAEYTCVVRDDDTNIIVIEFEHDERKEGWGCLTPMWISEDEMLDIEQSRKRHDYD